MQHVIEENGNLTLILDEGEADDIRNYREQPSSNLDESVLCSLLDSAGYIGNAILQLVRPEWIGALTDAPILTDSLDIEDDGEAKVKGRIWWFPNYMVEDVTKTLMDTGRVTFALAP